MNKQWVLCNHHRDSHRQQVGSFLIDADWSTHWTSASNRRSTNAIHYLLWLLESELFIWHVNSFSETCNTDCVGCRSLGLCRLHSYFWCRCCPSSLHSRSSSFICAHFLMYTKILVIRQFCVFTFLEAEKKLACMRVCTS